MYYFEEQTCIVLVSFLDIFAKGIEIHPQGRQGHLEST